MSIKYYQTESTYDESRAGKKTQLFINTCLGCTLFFNIIFFFSWLIAINFESSVVLNGNFFSKCFYFFNWNLWSKFILVGNLQNTLYSTVSASSIVFLILLFVSVFSFFAGFVSAVALLMMSVYYDQKEKKTLAIFYFFPVINTFLYVFYLIHRSILYYSVKMSEILDRSSYNEYLIKINNYLNAYADFFYSKQDDIFKKDKYEVLNIKKTNCRISEIQKVQDEAFQRLMK